MSKQQILTKVFFLFLLTLVLKTTNAQLGLNFQGVARNSNNVILASQPISLRLSILQGSATGNAEYTEVRKVITNAQGLFTAVIGDTGAVSSLGTFATINWKANPKFLKIEMDAAAGNNFITIGTTQFQSVAYAQFANSVDAENIAGIVPVARGGTGTNSLANLKTALALDKSSVGLTNVENTALSTWTGNDNITKVGTITSGTWNGSPIAVEKGGTGGTNSSQARRNLGLEIGTHVQAPLVAGSDYLTPTGSAAGLSNFPTLNQSTTGNAATATLAERATVANNIDATSNTTLTSLPNLAELGTITIGNWNGSSIAVEKGGTGASDAFNARVNLGLVIGTNVQAPLAAGVDYLAPNGSANNLTNFPILNQSTTGNAATATTATNVTGLVAIENGGTNSTAIPTAGGIGFGNGLSHAYTNSGLPGQILSSNGSADPTWVTPNTISVPYTGATSAVDLGAFDLRVNNLTIGVGAGNVLTNTVLGSYALNSNTTGAQNVAVGLLSLNANSSGIDNVAVGSSTLSKNTSGNSNTAIGVTALYNNEIGNYNTAIGEAAIFANVTGNNNVANGAEALRSNLTGSDNVAIGVNSLLTNISGNNNTAIGRDADVTRDGLTNATAIGSGAKVNDDNTIQLGNIDIRNVVTSGTMSATAYTGAWRGDIIDVAHGGTGTSVGPFVDVLTDQTINGSKIFSADATIGGLAIGTGIGSYSNNTVVGRNALSKSDNTGNFNTVIGSNVLSSNVAGNNNTSIGANAMLANTDGRYNSTLGAISLSSNTTGMNNTAIGYRALESNVTGSSNTAIGRLANVNGINLNNATAIGAGALVLASNTIQLGDARVSSVVTSGTINATGFVSATGYGTATGTSTQFLKANGTIDGTTYVNKDAYNISIGRNAGFSNQKDLAISIGTDAGGTDQGVFSIAIGVAAGGTSQGNNSVSIGSAAGGIGQGHGAIGIGENAAKTNQGMAAISIGSNAGKDNQGLNSIAIGSNAGVITQTADAIAIGSFAGNEAQGANSIALGSAAGETDQGLNSIAIGKDAGNEAQGAKSIAIGLGAGNSSQGINSIAIGDGAGNSNQAANSIILNATGSALSNSSTGFFVAPIQSATTSMPLYYNTITNEISYGAEANAGTLTGTTLASTIVNSSLTSVGTITSGTWSGSTIAVANGGTGLTSPGLSGNVLTSNGTDWVSAPISSSVDLTTAQTVSGSKSFTSNMRVGTETPTSSAVLEVSSTTQGFLPPRMTLAQRDAISSPATGLIIFCTNCTPNGDPEYFNGTRWTSMMSAAPLVNTIIGDQVWSNTNLNVSKYRNGDVIPQVTGTVFASLTTGAWCWFNDDSVTYAATYGKLYNWYAVNDPRGLAPLGWHIPSDAEWNILSDYLGGTTVAGGAMKQTGVSLWTTPNTGATNISGFAGLPGGIRTSSNTFSEVNDFGHWWTASALATTHARSRYLYFNTANLYSTSHIRYEALSVRCVRD